MSAPYPISQLALCEKLRCTILEALRANVPIETVQAALDQAHCELSIAAPIIEAVKDANHYP